MCEEYYQGKKYHIELKQVIWKGFFLFHTGSPVINALI